MKKLLFLWLISADISAMDTALERLYRLEQGVGYVPGTEFTQIQAYQIEYFHSANYKAISVCLEEEQLVEREIVRINGAMRDQTSRLHLEWGPRNLSLTGKKLYKRILVFKAKHPALAVVFEEGKQN